ncbi:MAG TPA: D-aminoacylase [Tepidisphaeraceae bacterium]|jgi:N-acyl-D-amino-acid deacylase|nr:D-aminoacylase [Tepidisphaeraceae bacterium]
MRFWILLLTLVAGCAADKPAFDLVIRGGEILDGSGREGFRADVGIAGGKIVKVGAIERGAGIQEIDATGLVVAPGFIDVHTHADEDVHTQPLAENFIRDGVTTIVTGNCGGSMRDVRGYFDRIEKKGAAINVATLIGHNTVLKVVKGDRAGELTAEQMARARELIAQAMRDGAVGMSTGLIYPPGQFSSTEEIIELQKVAASFGGIYASHMRSEGTNILPAIDEALRIGREAKCRVEISHFKLPADAARKLGGSDVTLGKVRAAREAGQEVWLDQYPYTASSTGITTLIPDEAIAEGVATAQKKLKDDPKEVEKLVAKMIESAEKSGRKHYGYVVIAGCAAHPDYAGQNILDLARAAKLRKERPGVELIGLKEDQIPPATIEDQIRMIVDIFASGGAQCVFHTMNEKEVENIMADPTVSVASDSGIRKYGTGAPHPRGYGTNARVLARYVREKKIISLPEAIRKMTSMPARAFRFADRGTIKEEYAADVVIFDAKTVADTATFEKPHQYPVGIEWVIVNGQVACDHGVMTGKLPGKVIRGPGYQHGH